MNKVYKNGCLLSFLDLCEESGFLGITPREMEERIKGRHCNCEPNRGVFDLLPKDDPAVIEGGKRYMVCRNCGGWSHL